MKAKEMFEELGYRLDDCSNDEKGIEYVYINFNAKKNINKEVSFTEKTKEIGMYDYDRFSFTLDEIKAVNMQLKELGWIE